MKIVLGLGRKRCCDDSVEIVVLNDVETCPTCGTANSRASNAQAEADGKELGKWIRHNVAGCYLDGLRKGIQG